MSVIDVDGLLQEISAEAPSGDNLEYDPSFVELESAVEGKEEQQMGDEVIPAEEPDWNEVRGKAIAFLERSKHLRVAVHLTRALLHTDGFPGFRDGLALLDGLLERHWDTVYPQLDPEDNNDPTERVNILSTLAHPASTLKDAREAAMVSSKSFGRFSLRDTEIAAGKLAPKESDAKVPKESDIHAAFMEAGIEPLRETDEALQQCIEHVQAIDTKLAERVGAANSVDLRDLPDVLRTVKQVVVKHLNELAPAGASNEIGADTVEGGIGAQRSTVGGITSRDDVIRALDLVCEYYRRNEPSSPIPLLLQRAKRLVSKDFLEIVSDLTPAGVQEAKIISGVSADE